MKRMFSFGVACLLTCNSFAQNLPKDVHLTSHNLFPYGSFPASSKPHPIANNTFSGLAVDVVRCAFNSLEIELTVHVLPPQKRSYQNIQIF